MLKMLWCLSKSVAWRKELTLVVSAVNLIPSQ